MHTEQVSDTKHWTWALTYCNQIIDGYWLPSASNTQKLNQRRIYYTFGYTILKCLKVSLYSIYSPFLFNCHPTNSFNNCCFYINWGQLDHLPHISSSTDVLKSAWNVHFAYVLLHHQPRPITLRSCCLPTPFQPLPPRWLPCNQTHSPLPSLPLNCLLLLWALKAQLSKSWIYWNTNPQHLFFVVT